MTRCRLTAHVISILLVFIGVGATQMSAATFPPVAVVNVYPERAPLNASNHGRIITGESVTFDGRWSYATRPYMIVTMYRWFVGGTQVQSGSSPVFKYTAGAAGTTVDDRARGVGQL